MANTDKFRRVGKPGTATTLSAPGHTSGGTSITVGSTTNWPTTTGVTFAIDRVTVSGSTETQVAGSYTLWVGDVTGATTIANMTLHADSPNSDQDYSAGSTTRVYIPVSVATHNDMVTGILVEHNQDGTHSSALITSRTADTAPASGDYILTSDVSAFNALKKVTLANLFATPPVTSGTMSATDWKEGVLPAVSSVTNNGNRSYDMGYASTVASLLSPGMRIRTTRTVTAPTYMGGAFNGTNHYFTKATATSTLSTVTDNFTMTAHVEPTAYAASYIMGRSDATPANGFGLKMESDGRVTVIVFNGGAANFRSVTTYQSLPLNKKTNVTASWASGTVVIYFDGISVPVATATTSGTAPTTAGTGGDFSVGRLGAFNGQYWTGYISGAGVFNAVLSAATIRSYIPQVLSGSETNCIGAWSLNNTGVNQQAAGTNDLTATNSVSYTVRSPYSTDGSGVNAGTTDYALVMKVSTTTATVQVPEGCTIPTSGGVSAVAYSTTQCPFGFTLDKDRWEIISLFGTSATSAALTLDVWTASNLKLSVPVGQWEVSPELDIQFSSGAATIEGFAGLNHSGISGSNQMDPQLGGHIFSQAATTVVIATFKRTKRFNLSAARDFTVTYKFVQGTGTVTAVVIGSAPVTGGRIASYVYAIPAGV